MHGLLTSPTRLSALLVSSGALLSGPVAMLAVTRLAPQPPWTDAATFALHYHPIQALPYVLGFGLLAGFVLFASACFDRAPEQHRVRAVAALIFTGVYAALVFTNYMLQVGVVPRMLIRRPDLVEVLTMSNPASLAWFLEMFGYAALGVAMAFVAPLFGGTGVADWVRRLLHLNTALSLAGAVLTASIDRWVFSTSGMVSFFAWNLIVIVCFGLIGTHSETELLRQG